MTAAKWYPVWKSYGIDTPIGRGFDLKTSAEIHCHELLAALDTLDANFSISDFETRLLTDEQVEEMRGQNG